MQYSALHNKLNKFGFSPLGGFVIDDKHPVVGHEKGSLVLIGNVGSKMWQVFDRDAKSGAISSTSDLLDNWTRSALLPLKTDFDVNVYLPFEAPYRPFSTWATWTERYFISSLGLAIHHHYGLWSGFRGALVSHDPDFVHHVLPEALEPLHHPCESCADKPCLNSCPVSAFKLDDYNVAACREFVRNQKGDCHKKACLARRACPIGHDYHYEVNQARYHMKSFAGT